MALTLRLATGRIRDGAAWRETIGSPLSPDEKNQLDPYLNLVRAQLDDAALAQAWESGRTLTLEKAVAYALEATDQR